MLNLLKQETEKFKLFLQNNFQVTIILASATLFLLFQQHYTLIFSRTLSQFIYYFILPITTTILILHQNLLDFGLRIGNFKLWFFYILLSPYL